MRRAGTSNRIWLLVALILALLATSGPAWAHAQLLSSDPAADAVVDTAPEAVELTFNEPVTALAVTLIDPQGGRQDLLSATTSGAVLSVRMPQELGQGTYVLSWRAASLDSHPIGSSLVFSVGVVSGNGAAAATAGDPAVAAALWGSKVLLFVALFGGVGAAAFGLAAPLPAGVGRSMAGLAALGAVAAVASLGLHGTDAIGGTLGQVASAGAWQAGLATSYGLTVGAALGAFVLAGLALAVPSLAALGWPAWALGALSLVISGHAGTAEPQWLTRPAVFLHIGGILFWVGALLPLALHLRDRGEAGRVALARFSAFIPYAVAAIVVSGAVLAFIQMGPPGPQWATGYGFILAGKLALLVVLFALALWNRFFLTRPALAGEARATRHLRRSIGVEIAIVLAILGLVAGWRFTPPPRALALVEASAATASEPLFVHLMDDTAMAMVTITPGGTGPVSMAIDLTDMSGAPLEAMSVTVSVAAPDKGIEPIKREAKQSDGVWRLEGLNIPVAGIWQLDLDIRVSRFSLVRLQSPVEVP